MVFLCISNRLSAAAANSSVVFKLLLFALILSVAMPLMAQQSKQAVSGKQSWRAVGDGPYRIISAHPPLKFGGEAFSELGFESTEALLSGVDKRSYFFSVAFSPDGALLATGSDDNSVRLWDVHAKTLVHTFLGHKGWVNSIAFSPDGGLLATGSGDKTIKLWDVQARKLVHTFAGHAGWVSCVAYSPDGGLLATGSDDRTVRLWDVKSQKWVHTFVGHTGWVNSVAFSPDGALIASGSGNKTVKLWDVKARSLVHTFEGYTGRVNSVAFSPDGGLLATGSDDKAVKLWDVQVKTLVHTFVGHTGWVNSVAFSPDGSLIATGSEDNSVRLWDVQAGTLVHTFVGHTGWVDSVVFSPAGGLVATGSGDKTVRLWDVQAKTLVHTFEGHTGRITSVAFSPGGGLLATASEDNTVRLWEMPAKTLSHTLVEGNGANWLSIDAQRHLLRGDDGTMLKKRAIENGAWLPVPVAGQSGHDNFSISVVPQSITLFPGESKEIRIRVTNSGSHPAYWLHLKPSASRDDAIRLDPPDHLLIGQGAQAWKPARIGKLEPGGTATLYAVIRPNLKLPAAFIHSGIHQLALTVVSANSTAVSQSINVTVQSPNLEWQRAVLDQDGRTLKIQLRNSGKAALRDFTLDLYARQADRAARISAQPLSDRTIRIKELAPAAATKQVVGLPDGIDLKSKKLTLEGRTHGLPLFSWILPSPNIERAGP